MRLYKNFGILIIVSVWIVFSYPFFFKGLVPFPSDYLVSFFSPWSAYNISGPTKNDAMPDIIGQIYPWRKLVVDIYKSGQIPLWNPYSFSGTPLLANYQSAALNPLNLGFLIFKFIDWWSFLILLQPLFAGVFTYLFVKSLRKSTWAAVISSLSFMFCGFITTWMEYGTLALAISYLPLALYSIEKYLSTLKFRYLVLLFFTIPFSFFSGHFQISLYFLTFLVAFILFKFIIGANKLILFKIIFISILGFIFSFPQLMPTIEFYLQSLRSGLFLKIESIPLGFIPTIIVPDYFGNPVTRNMWFGHYAEWNGYVGVVAFFFAVYSFFRIKDNYVKFFSILAVISLFLAYDTPFQNIFVFIKIPVLSTSSLSRIIVIFSFSAAVLAAFGFDDFIEDLKKKKIKKVIITSLVYIVIFASVWVLPIFRFFTPEHSKIAISNLKLPTLIFVFLLFSVCLSVFLKRRKLLTFICIFIISLSALEMVRFAAKWNPFSNKSYVYPSVGVTSKYSHLSKEGRVFGNFGGEDTVYYKIPGVEGYDALYIRRYGQLISSLRLGELTDSGRSVVELPLDGKYLLKGGNLLGIKYFIHKVSDGQQVWEYPFWEYDPKSLELIFDDNIYEILQNKNALERAYLVEVVKVEKNPQKIISKLFSRDFDLNKQALIEENLSLSKFSSGSATIKEYTPNKVSIETNSKDKSFLVLTDVYYPGWTAYINNKKTKIYRTNYTFRGILIPKGKNNIEFRYEPNSFRLGLYLAIIALGGLILTYFFTKRRNKNG